MPFADEVEEVWRADGEDLVDRDGFELGEGVAGANKIEPELLELFWRVVGVKKQPRDQLPRDAAAVEFFGRESEHPGR